MKKKLLLVLMLIAAVVVMPRVYADETKTISPAVVTDITNSDTLIGDKPNDAVKTADNGDVTITYENSKFKILGAGSQDTDSEGREDGYAWIGFRVTVPTNATKYTLTRGEKELAKDESVSSTSTFDRYVGISVENLTKAANEGKDLVYAYDLTWEGENGTTPLVQHITVVVKPGTTTLLDKEEENKEVWNTTKYEENIKKVKVTIKAMKDGKEETLPETAVTEYTLKEVYTLSDEQLTAIKSVLTDENLELVGLYTDPELKTELDTTKALDADVTVYVAYKTKVEEPAPNTVDNVVMYIALAGASLLVAGGIAVHFKKVNE